MYAYGGLKVILILESAPYYLNGSDAYVCIRKNVAFQETTFAPPILRKSRFFTGAWSLKAHSRTLATRVLVFETSDSPASLGFCARVLTQKSMTWPGIAKTLTQFLTHSMKIHLKAVYYQYTNIMPFHLIT